MGLVSLNGIIDPKRLIFLHGLEGSSLGVKASLLRGFFPGMLTPDFHGALDERMAALYGILGEESGWTIVGSSFGGLMGALYTLRQPGRVRKLVLLAPALVWPEFVALTSERPSMSSTAELFEPVSVPTIVYHGSWDEIVPLEPVRELAKKVFLDLDFRVVDDDHGLYKTVHELDWKVVLA